MLSTRSRSNRGIPCLEEENGERPVNDRAGGLQSGQAVVFMCPEGYGLGHLTGRYGTTESGGRIYEVRLAGGCLFIRDDFLSIVPNEAVVMRVVGRC